MTSLQTHVADEGTQAAAKPATRCGVATATWKKTLGLINAMFLHERRYPRLLDANAQYHALYKLVYNSSILQLNCSVRSAGDVWIVSD